MIFQQKRFYKIDAIQLTEYNASKVWAFIQESKNAHEFKYNESENKISTYYKESCEVGTYFYKMVPNEHTEEIFADHTSGHHNYLFSRVGNMSKKMFEMCFEKDEND